MDACRVSNVLPNRAFLLQQTHGFFHFYGLVFFRQTYLIYRVRPVWIDCFRVSDMYHAVTFIEIEMNPAAFVHIISAAVGNRLMVDLHNMFV